MFISELWDVLFFKINLLYIFLENKIQLNKLRSIDMIFTEIKIHRNDTS